MMEFTAVNVILISFFESAVAFYLFPNVIPNGPLTSFIIVSLLLNSSAYLSCKLIIYPFFLSPFRHLPKPAGGWPIIGHGLIVFERPAGHAHLRFIKDTVNDGLIHWRSFLHADRLLVTSPAAIADVLVHNSYDFEKPPRSRSFLRIFLGDGLLVSEGDEHKHQRKHITPAFHFRHIKELYPFFWLKSTELCECIKRELQEGTGSVIDIGHFSTQVAMDIIGLAGLGRDIGSLRNSDDELIKNYEEILEPTREKAFFFLLHMMFPQRFIRALPWKINEMVTRTTANLRRLCTEFLAEKKSRVNMESSESVDILSIMLRSNNFSDETLVDQLLTFLAAG
jgi:cytochrome P450